MILFRSYLGVNRKVRHWLSSMPTLTNFLMKSIFSITTDVNEMQERCNKLMVLDFLGALRPKFSKARPNVIGSSIVK